MAGRMVLADDDQPRVMAVDPRSCRPGRRSAVDVHPRWRAAAQAGGDAVGAGRAGLREEAAEVDERKERRSEEHTSELQSLMRISYAVFCLKKKKTKDQQKHH